MKIIIFPCQLSPPQQAQQDIVLEEYEQFDDYLEMVVQFGVSVYFAK